jgi:DNA-binding response OmpR family regulator
VDGDLTLDFTTRTVARDTREIHLTQLEFELLRYLAEHAGRIVHRDALHRAVWGYTDVSFTRSLDNAIVRLRRKIETDPTRPRIIHTARGDGYVLAAPD